MTTWNDAGLPLSVDIKDVSRLAAYIKMVIEYESEPTWQILDNGDIWPVTLGSDIDTDDWNIPENYIQPLIKIVKK